MLKQCILNIVLQINLECVFFFNCSGTNLLFYWESWKYTKFM